MNQTKHTLSRQDRKLIMVLAFFQIAFIWLGISLSDWFWHGAMLKAFKMKETYELGQWATDEVKKIQTEKKIEAIKESYKNQGINVEEF